MGSGISQTPIWLLGLLLFVATVAAALAGGKISGWLARKEPAWGKLTESQEGYVVTIVYTLLGLLVGFTFSIAVDRYQHRRALVLSDATAIEQLYLQAQLLGEPHRTRISNLLIAYAENHLRLAQLQRDDADAQRLLDLDETQKRDLWTLTVPAFQSIKSIDFSSLFVQSANDVLRVDAERTAERRLEIPRSIIGLLVLYSIVAAGLLGAVMKSKKGYIVSVFLLGLSTLALTLIIDLNRPVEGLIREPQEPMQRMLGRLKANPPAVYQRLSLPAD